MAGKLFVTGTGTDIGKTFVTALIVKKLMDNGCKAAYFKAAMSGNERGKDGRLIPGDASYVKKISGIEQPLGEMCPFVYEKAYSPHLAARIEGRPVEMDIVKSGCRALEGRYDYITMEGSGGIICPIRIDDKLHIRMEDIIGELDMPCVIISDGGLGTINDTVLTAFYMKQKGMRVKGIIFNNYIEGDVMHEDNLLMCERLTGLKVLACVRAGDTELRMEYEEVLRLYE